MKNLGQTLQDFISFTKDLQTLRLQSSHIPDISLLPILAGVPALKHLQIIDSFIGRKFATGIIRDSKDTDLPMCPKLRSLHLESCPLLSGELLMDLVQARNSSSSPLATLNIGSCDLVEARHLNALSLINPLQLEILILQSD